MTDDLWPTDLFNGPPIRAPVSILREQAAFLATSSGSLIEGDIETQTDDLEGASRFAHGFFISTPELGFRYLLLTVEHGPDLYPALVRPETGIFSELSKEHVDLTMTRDRKLVAENEAALVKVLRLAFAATQTRRIVRAITAQLAGGPQSVRYLESLKQDHVSSVGLYGAAFSYQRVTCEVLPNGAARITRRARLIASRPLDAFTTYVYLPEQKDEASLPSTEIRSLDDERQLAIGPAGMYRGSSVTTVQIDPPLQAGESVEFRQVYRDQYRVFRTPLNRKHSSTPDDYFSWDINYPTEQLSILVTLPPDLVVVSHKGAAWTWIGSNRHTNPREDSRVGSAVRSEATDGVTWSMGVDYPLINTAYAITWIPDDSYSVIASSQSEKPNSAR